MKQVYCLLIAAFILHVPALAQQKDKSEKKFLQALNQVLKKTPQQHWNYEGQMTIDTAFKISPDGILSVTVRYKTDSSFYRVRMAAPFEEIQDVVQDVYLIFQFDSKLVQVYESEPNSEVLKPAYRLPLLHVGVLEDGDEKTLSTVQRLFAELLNSK